MEFHDRLNRGMWSRAPVGDVVAGHVHSDLTFSVVTPSSVREEQNHVGDLKKIADRLNLNRQYKIPSYGHPCTGWHALLAYVPDAMNEGLRAIGFSLASLRDWKVKQSTWAEISAETESGSLDCRGTTMVDRWTVGFFWIHPAERGRGFSEHLLRATSTWLQVEPQDLAWHAPISVAGQAGISQLVGDPVWVGY